MQNHRYTITNNSAVNPLIVAEKHDQYTRCYLLITQQKVFIWSKHLELKMPFNTECVCGGFKFK